MKKFLIAAVLAACSVLLCTLTSCDKISGKFSTADSTVVAKMIDNSINPAFDNADQFTRYALDKADYQEFIEVVQSLESITIASVASNVVREYKYVDYNGFLREYKKNKTMYDTFDQETKRACVDKDAKQPVDVSFQMALKPVPDTINVK